MYFNWVNIKLLLIIRGPWRLSSWYPVLCSLPCNSGLVSQSRLNIPISLEAQATRSRLSSEHDSDLSLKDGRFWTGLAALHHPWHLPGARLPGSVRSSKQGHNHKMLMRSGQALMRTCWSITSWPTGAMRTSGVTVTTTRRSWSKEKIFSTTLFYFICRVNLLDFVSLSLVIKLDHELIVFVKRKYYFLKCWCFVFVVLDLGSAILK